jgi:VWFA-related protein
MKRIALALVVLALVLPAAAQEQQPFQERIDVNVVLLDVIVTDARGNQILGLAKDDFVVKENGAEQPLESVDYFTNRKLLDQREENAPFKVEQVHEERYFIFFFDKPQDPGVLSDQLARAREAARQFVRKEMKEGDRVAVAGHDHRLKVYSDFTSDRKAIEKAINDVARFGNGLTEPVTDVADASILRHVDRGTLINRTGTVYEALDVLARAVKPIRGRKNLVLFSPGIMEINEDEQNGMIVNRSRHLDPAIESLNAANVTVYPIQLQKEVAIDPMFHQRLEELAGSTGGEYYRFNVSFSPALDRIDDANAGYYLLSYRVPRQRGLGGFQKVNVSIRNHPELRVNSRSGYQFGG